MVSKVKKNYDLNLLIPNDSIMTNASVLQLIENCIIDGYTGFALNVVKSAPLIEKDLIAPPKINIAALMKDQITKSLSLRESMDWNYVEIEQYNRITIEISDQKHAALFNDTNKIYKVYDIIAVRPTNEKLFDQCCEKIDCDIISLDLADKMNFFFKKQKISEAISRGITFEICYSNGLANSTKRKYLFTNGIALSELCNGKNIIVSSEAQDYMSHRSPLDVKIMSSLLGIAEKHRENIIGLNCENVINRSKSRRIFKGVLQVANFEDVKKAMESKFNKEIADKVIEEIKKS